MSSYMYDQTRRLPCCRSAFLPTLNPVLNSWPGKQAGPRAITPARPSSKKIEDLEDAYLGEQVLERIRKGEEKVLSAEEMWRDLED